MTDGFHLLRSLPRRKLQEAERFIVAEQKKGTNELGFIPCTELPRFRERGQCAVLLAQDDLVAFSIWTAKKTTVRVAQTWVRQDARLIQNGRDLVEGIEAVAWLRGHLRISCWCASELPAMIFWHALGFTKTKTRPGGKSRGRVLQQFVRELSQIRRETLQAVASQLLPPGVQTGRPSRSKLASEAPQLLLRQRLLF